MHRQHRDPARGGAWVADGAAAGVRRASGIGLERQHRHVRPPSDRRPARSGPDRTRGQRPPECWPHSARTRRRPAQRSRASLGETDGRVAAACSRRAVTPRPGRGAGTGQRFVDDGLGVDRGVGLAGRDVDDALGDRHGVVGEALVEAREQRDVDGRLDAVLPRGRRARSGTARGAGGPSPRRCGAMSAAIETSLVAMTEPVLATTFCATAPIAWKVGAQLRGHGRARGSAAGPTWRCARRGRPCARARPRCAGRRR